jgi:hypothetical protein
MCVAQVTYKKLEREMAWFHLASESNDLTQCCTRLECLLLTLIQNNTHMIEPYRM